jgi:hypothetical protein
MKQFKLITTLVFVSGLFFGNTFTSPNQYDDEISIVNELEVIWHNLSLMHNQCIVAQESSLDFGNSDAARNFNAQVSQWNKLVNKIVPRVFELKEYCKPDCINFNSIFKLKPYSCFELEQEKCKAFEGSNSYDKGKDLFNVLRFYIDMKAQGYFIKPKALKDLKMLKSLSMIFHKLCCIKTLEFNKILHTLERSMHRSDYSLDYFFYNFFNHELDRECSFRQDYPLCKNHDKKLKDLFIKHDIVNTQLITKWKKDYSSLCDIAWELKEEQIKNEPESTADFYRSMHTESIYPGFSFLGDWNLYFFHKEQADNVDQLSALPFFKNLNHNIPKAS